MGTRKRHGHSKGTNGKADGNGVSSKPVAPSGSSSRPVLVASSLIFLVILSAGVYAYNFMDLTDILDTVQTRASTVLSGSKSAESSSNQNLHNSQKSSQSEGSAKHDAKNTAKNAPSSEEKKQKTDNKPKRSEETSTKAAYSKASITNVADNKIRTQLDQADALIEKKQADEALRKFDSILSRYPDSARATFGKAQSLDVLSEQRQSNPLLEQAIHEYKKVLELPNVPKDLALKAAKRGTERMQFRGWTAQGIKTIKKLLTLYPEEYVFYNDLGVQYLIQGRTDDAKEAFRKVLNREPDNGFALVHLGFIHKTSDNNPLEAIPLLQKGIDSLAEGTLEGKFYFHLGDAYNRVGRVNESKAVYQLGADRGLFLSKNQRSLYNVDGLTGRPWWSKQQTGHAKMLKMLESNWKKIRDEAVAQLNTKSGLFEPEEENLREKGDWKQFTLYSRGRKHESSCAKVPFTCSLIDKFPDAAGCKRGQVKFSVMQPGVHVWPHTGPTNCRIRSHLGLVVPPGPKIRVADDIKTWEEGKFIIFDDSFEHEVWHEGESFRLVLIIDIWHPELTARQKASLSPI